MELVHHHTLADSIGDLRSRKITRTFFIQINSLIQRKPFLTIINLYCKKGKSGRGKPSCSGLSIDSVAQKLAH